LLLTQRHLRRTVERDGSHARCPLHDYFLHGLLRVRLYALAGAFAPPAVARLAHISCGTSDLIGEETTIDDAHAQHDDL
jgi:hypothetical protein